MKTQMLKIFSWATLLVLASCTNEFDDIVAPSDVQLEYSPSYGVEFVDQREAVQAFQKLQEGLSDGMTTKSSEEQTYPDYYGGCYIDENNQLVVYVVSDTTQAKARVLSMTDNAVITKVGQYSYNELKRIMKVIGDYSQQNAGSTLVSNMATVSLMDMENHILVKLYDCSEQRINEFKSTVIDSPALVFEQQEDPIELFADDNVVSPGCAIASGGNKNGSLGYRVSRNGDEGYITAAHFVSQNNFIYRNLIEDISKPPVYGVQFAQCTDWKWSGNLDAAYCSSTYLADYSNTIAYTSVKLGNRLGTLIAGLTIYKSGQVTHNTNGVIMSTSAQATSDGITITDLISSTCYATKGDSGGIAYTLSFGTEGEPIGIVHGGDINGTLTYFVKASNINAYFGCTFDN